MASGGGQDTEQDIAWTADQESSLFHSMQGHRPVGIAKHFHLACIANSFSNTIGMVISPERIWKHLRQMYDLETLDEREDLPFPNEESDFALPLDFLDEPTEEDEDDRDEKPAAEAASSTLPEKNEKSEKKGSVGRRGTPEPSAVAAATPASTKRKRTRVSAAATGSSPPSPNTPAAKRRRA